MMNNRKHNSKNPYQGKAKKVLCVCSAGLLRSPTAAYVLQLEFNHNTRSAGLDKDYALIPIDDVLLYWADEIVCMNVNQKSILSKLTDKPVINLNIEDEYEYMNIELQTLILVSYRAKSR